MQCRHGECGRGSDSGLSFTKRKNLAKVARQRIRMRFLMLPIRFVLNELLALKLGMIFAQQLQLQPQRFDLLLKPKNVPARTYAARDIVSYFNHKTAAKMSGFKLPHFDAALAGLGQHHITVQGAHPALDKLYNVGRNLCSVEDKNDLPKCPFHNNSQRSHRQSFNK
jgi:hypothetical protein